MILFFASAILLRAASADALFQEGTAAYRASAFTNAADAFRQSAALSPAPGALRNLGNAEWQRGDVGDAVLAWEQALWLDPFDSNSRSNLRFARVSAQLEAPELRWWEVASGWLPSTWWAWIAAISLWIVAGAMTLPAVLRRRKSGWSQALAAIGLMLFLLSLPALLGIYTRSHHAFILKKNVPLRLTPTQEAQTITRLTAGEPCRWLRSRGNYFFIRSSRAAGWVSRDELGLLCPP